MIGRSMEQLAVGDVAALSRVATAHDLAGFVDSVGDRNPVHSDPAFAAATPFREPIAPGIWTAGLISALIGTRLPGPGSIYVSQELRFLRPVKLGDTITARVEIAELVPERNRARLKTTCLNQRGEEVLSGEAWVLPPKQLIHYVEEPPGGAALSGWMLQPFACAAQVLAFWWTLGASAFALGVAPGGRHRG